MEAGVRIGWVRLRAWELTVEKAEVEVVASGERGGCVVCKAAAAAGSESRGLRSTNHPRAKATVYCCPMSVRWPCARTFGEKVASIRRPNCRWVRLSVAKVARSRKGCPRLARVFGDEK